MEVRKQLGWGIASKSKAQNPKQSNIFKIRTSFLNLKLQINRLLAQGHWSCTPTHYFYSYTYIKTYLAVHFTKGCFWQFVDRKVVGLMQKYYLLAGDINQVSIFSLRKIKMNKQHRFIL